MPNSFMFCIHVTPLVLTDCAIVSSFSKSATLIPFFDASYATEEPAGPPPTITKS